MVKMLVHSGAHRLCEDLSAPQIEMRKWRSSHLLPFTDFSPSLRQKLCQVPNVIGDSRSHGRVDSLRPQKFSRLAAHARFGGLQSRQECLVFGARGGARNGRLDPGTRFGAYLGSFDRSDCAATIFAFRRADTIITSICCSPNSALKNRQN